MKGTVLSRVAIGAALAAVVLVGVDAAAQTSSPPPAATPVASRPGDHVLRLTNGGHVAVTAVYYAPQGSLDWSDDLLGSQTAGAGRTVTVKIKDPQGVCVFDLQFLMSDGSTANRKAVNVCDPSDYSFTP